MPRTDGVRWSPLHTLHQSQEAGDKLTFVIVRPGGLKSEPATGTSVLTGELEGWVGLVLGPEFSPNKPFPLHFTCRGCHRLWQHHAG